MLIMSTRAARRPPASAAFLAIVQAAEELQRGMAELLKTRDLSMAQYNVLRILRGAGPEGATCSDVGDNLVRHDPDVTRLLDRLDKRGLIDRARDTKDRRVVRTRITKAGAALVGELDDPVDELHARQLGHVGSKRLADLVAVLDETRAKLP
ncbi:MAG TPA: MarR family transcriptional regulator [Vicinamibacterales bacterium]|nr:MarR family transcriptional regulator [Vicinamibacterales bacterium]